MQRGVFYGVLAGAIWGAIFLVPRTLPEFSPVQIAAGRYMMYGVVSVVLALPSARSLLARLTRRDLAELVRLALVGNLLYYILVTDAVHTIGVAPASLIIGVLPVSVTLAGRGDHGAVPVARLVVPLSLVMAGIVCINVDVFSGGTHGASLALQLGGLASAVGALASWTWFAVENSRYLRRHTHFSGSEWSMLWGVVTGGLGALLWVVLLGWQAGMAALHAGGTDQLDAAAAIPASRWTTFWLLNLFLAIGPSWLGNTLWNAAQKRLPLTLSGQLIVFETLFALFYGFIYDARLPRPLELAAVALLVIGVSWSVRLHAGERRGAATSETPDAVARDASEESVEDKAQPQAH
ncbi:DMT family transporter [Paraburkholderia phosphatilytica]|uniref:DMT family transporter n=1 Tax=Paraburkholderia phosphatilytica TaxID=2282883 RepID=UPI000E53D8F7|nr:DMT family transporter [Paraburkholderia phosphatilytica]